MAVTDEAIGKIKDMIVSGGLRPGDRLPREADLAERLGLSRSSLREAVKALSLIRVLDVRQGDGTYVTSLEPGLLLEGVGIAVELVQGETLLELIEVRRLVEPVATALAASRISAAELAVVKGHLDAMREARDDVERLIRHDAAFHRAVTAATGNQTLTTLLERIAAEPAGPRVAGTGRRQRGRPHPGRARGDLRRPGRPRPVLSQAAALLHVSSTENWLRPRLAPDGNGVANP